MNRFTIDDLRAALPELDELRPLVDYLVATSVADPERTWSGSSELGTAGDRLVEPLDLEEASERLALEVFEHRSRIYGLAARAIAALTEGDAEAATEALLQAASLEAEKGEAPRAAAYADAAYRLARDAGDATLASLTLRRRARHRRAEGRYEDARRDYEEALVLAEAAEDPRGAAEACVGAGNVCEEQARWGEAEDWYRRALSLLGSHEPPVPEQWHALLNLHVVLRSMGSLEGCLEPLREAEALVETLDDSSAVPFLENAWGQYHMALRDFDTAEQHLRRGVAESADARSEITIRLNLAETLFARGRHLDAAEEARRAERRAIVSSMPQKLPEVYRLLGRILADEGILDAFVLFERALQIVDARDLPAIERARTLQAYGEAESSLGDTATGRELLSEADRLYERLGIEHRRDAWSDRYQGERPISESNQT
ncbi:MAG: tetratricopeptide repeat protein [Gemmatimonadota bacterium]|nr:tetratricopeptide repeat protein [Gemmatimonadota bacterium]